MFPWIRIGKGHRYVVHHMNYKNLGYERLGRDVVPLSPFAHNFVIHGVLAGFKSAGKQGNYPNILQRTVHFWCNQRLWFKVLLLFSVLFAGAYSHLWSNDLDKKLSQRCENFYSHRSTSNPNSIFKYPSPDLSWMVALQVIWLILILGSVSQYLYVLGQRRMVKVTDALLFSLWPFIFNEEILVGESTCLSAKSSAI